MTHQEKGIIKAVATAMEQIPHLDRFFDQQKVYVLKVMRETEFETLVAIIITSSKEFEEYYENPPFQMQQIEILGALFPKGQTVKDVQNDYIQILRKQIANLW